MDEFNVVDGSRLGLEARVVFHTVRHHLGSVSFPVHVLHGVLPSLVWMNVSLLRMGPAVLVLILLMGIKILLRTLNLEVTVGNLSSFVPLRGVGSVLLSPLLVH